MKRVHWATSAVLRHSSLFAVSSALLTFIPLASAADTDRLLAEKPGGMCQYKVKLAAASEVDAELVGWIRQAYDAAG